MAKTVSKTFRLDSSVVLFVDEKSKEWNMSQSETLEKVISEYKKYVRHKQYKEEIIRASKDKEFLKEQMELAEASWISDGI